MALKPMPFGSVFGELTVLDRTTNDFYGRSRYWATYYEQNHNRRAA